MERREPISNRQNQNHGIEALETWTRQSIEPSSGRGSCGLFGRQMLNVEQLKETIYSACVVTLSKEEERRPLKMRTIQSREDGFCLCIALVLSHFKAMSKCGE